MKDNDFMRLLDRLGEELSRRGGGVLSLKALARALRSALRLRDVMREARIRNNIALTLHRNGRRYLAVRQIVRAMGLVSLNAGSETDLYAILQHNLRGINQSRAPQGRRLTKGACDANKDMEPVWLPVFDSGNLFKPQGIGKARQKNQSAA